MYKPLNVGRSHGTRGLTPERRDRHCERSLVTTTGRDCRVGPVALLYPGHEPISHMHVVGALGKTLGYARVVVGRVEENGRDRAAQVV